MKRPELRLIFFAIATLFAPLTTYASARSEPITPIEPAKITEPDKVELGKQLFFDPRLSLSGVISCNSCHNLLLSGTDNLKTSVGHQWQAGPVNSPTVFNANMALAQFWDGRAADLKAQAEGPIQADVEMAMPHNMAIEVIRSIPGYRKQMSDVYGDDNVNLGRITTAIAAFEETLVTPNSRFDQWLNGDDKAITQQEHTGYQLFKSSGCVACHNGPAAGGTSFQKMGLFAEYKSSSPSQGRFDVTGKEADRFQFKVPTLRNVELTYPYFHDGAVATLEEAVKKMGELQLGKTYTKQEIADIVAFLGTLTGERPVFELPLLPPSGENTHRPQPFK